MKTKLIFLFTVVQALHLIPAQSFAAGLGTEVCLRYLKEDEKPKDIDNPNNAYAKMDQAKAVKEIQDLLPAYFRKPDGTKDVLGTAIKELEKSRQAYKKTPNHKNGFEYNARFDKLNELKEKCGGLTELNFKSLEKFKRLQKEPPYPKTSSSEAPKGAGK